MNFDAVAGSLSPEVYSRLKEAVELGKWPNGVALTKEQKALCLEACLKYEISNGVPEQARTGYIDRPESVKRKAEKLSDIQVINLPGAGDTLQ